jgi:hypothetical protein
MKRTFSLIVVLALLLTVSLTLAQGEPDEGALSEMLESGDENIEFGELILNEPFNGKNDWVGWDNDNGVGVEDDGVFLGSSEAEYINWSASADEYSDTVLQITAEPVDGPDNNGYGLTCRQDFETGAGYLFMISSDGYATIQSYDGEDFTQLVEWDRTNDVNQGNEINEVTVVCVGEYLALYANGELQAETTDDEYSEGHVGVTVVNYEDRDTVEVQFDNLYIWEVEGSGGGNDGGNNNNNNDNNADSGMPQFINNIDGDSDEAIAELEDAGAIPNGSQLIFGEDFAFFTGQGSWFTPLARRQPHTDVVMAGNLTFTIGDPNEFEVCNLTARIGTDSGGTATTYVDVGFDNQGYLVVFDLFDENEDGNVVVSDEQFDLDDSHHLLFIMIGEELTAYVNGELTISGFEVQEREGTYGISLLGAGSDARCEGRDIWAVSLD